jgi:hypothetical protein
VNKLSKLVDALKEDETVKRYIYLRSVLMSNDEYKELLKSKLSLNDANIASFDIENLINEYSEVEKDVKNDLEMIGNIINDEININFLK